jgi:hypothetical protein
MLASAVAPGVSQTAAEGLAAGEATEMRLADGRFLVQATWRAPGGVSGQAQAVQLANSFGYFWFFNADNAELFVKIVDACTPPFSAYWMFASGLTNVEVHMTVRDLVTGLEKTYDNPQDRFFPPIFDTAGFATCDAPDPLPHCFDFTGIAPGVRIGEGYGQAPGQVIFDEGGIKVRVDNFRFQNGNDFFGYMEFQGDATNIALWVSNITFEIDFTGLPFLPRRVTMDFDDWGGYENLSINRQPAAPYAGELIEAPCPLGGVACSFTGGPVGVGGWRGVATFTGGISYLRLGGQELLVDNLCAWPN